MSYVPAYPERIEFENEPSTRTPLNDVILNKMDYAIYQHDQALQGQDGRINTLETANKVSSFNGRTGDVTPQQDDYTIAQIKATGTAGQVPTLNSQGKLEMQDPDAGGHEIVNPSGTSMPQRSKLKVMGNVSVSDDSANDQTVINVTGGGGGGSGHTIQNPSGSSMTQRTNLQFTGTGVTVTDDASGDKTVVNINGGGGSGHTIKDGDGTAMTPQPNLQFADANVENDGTNNATVVRNFVDIDWDDWQEVDDNDDTYYRVTDAPLVDGNVEVDLMKKLWENPSPSASFVAQTITLNSDDYDFLLIPATNTSTGAVWDSPLIPKGKSFTAKFVSASGSSAVNVWRDFTYVSDTSYNVGSGARSNASGAYDTALVPLAIYGIKQKFRISLSAIISNVSTSAENCMMPDGETSVAEFLTETDISNSVDFGTTGVSNGYKVIYRQGNLVTLNVRCLIALSNNITILTGLPAPSQTLNLAFPVGGPMSFFTLDTNGVLKMTSAGATGSQNAGINLSYYCA